MTEPEGAAGSEPVGCGADSTFAGVAAWGAGDVPPFFVFAGLPLAAARAAALAAFFSFLACFCALMSSAV